MINDTIYDAQLLHNLELIIKNDNYIAKQEMETLLSQVQQFYCNNTYQFWKQQYNEVMQYDKVRQLYKCSKR